MPASAVLLGSPGIRARTRARAGGHLAPSHRPRSTSWSAQQSCAHQEQECGTAQVGSEQWRMLPQWPAALYAAAYMAWWGAAWYATTVACCAVCYRVHGMVGCCVLCYHSGLLRCMLPHTWHGGVLRGMLPQWPAAPVRLTKVRPFTLSEI